MNNDLEMLWKVLSQNLPGRAEENHENLSQDNRSPGRDSNPTSRTRSRSGLQSTAMLGIMSEHFKVM
jgi:hypothetical protein